MKKIKLYLIFAALINAAFAFSQSTTRSYTSTLNFLNSDFLQEYEGLRIAVPSMTLPNSLNTYTSTLNFLNTDNRQVYNAIRGVGDAISSLTASIPTATNFWGITGNAVSTNTNFIGTTTNRSLLFYTNAIQRLKIDSLGLLSLPSNTNTNTNVNGSLWYNSNTNNGFQLYSNDPTNSGYHSVFSNSTAALGIYLSNAGGTKVQIGTQTDDDLGFFTGATGSVKMRINKTGNIGIGLTTDQQSMLSIAAGNATNSAILLTNQATVSSPTNGSIWYQSSPTGTVNASGFTYYSNDAGFAAKIATWRNASTGVQMYISSSGSSIAGRLQPYRNQGIALTDSAGNNGIRIDPSGRAVIGATSGTQTAQLHVVGNINSTTSITAVNFLSSGTSTVSGNFVTSDIRAATGNNLFIGGSSGNKVLLGEAGNAYMVIQSSGTQIGNSSAPVASAVLDLNTTTQGFLPPTLTTAQKNAISSPAEGLIVYDTTLHKLCVYTGSAWETITSL